MDKPKLIIMNKIEEAAGNYAEMSQYKSDYPHHLRSSYDGFMAGAVSQEAKEYWLEELTKEFESKSDDDTISVIEVINKVLKSDMAKEYWQKGLYTEEEAWLLINQANALGIHRLDIDILEWFNHNKKK